MKDEILELTKAEKRFEQRRSMAEKTREEIFKQAKIDAEQEGHLLNRENELLANRLEEEARRQAKFKGEIVFQEEEAIRKRLQSDFDIRKEQVKALLIEEVFNLGNR